MLTVLNYNELVRNDGDEINLKTLYYRCLKLSVGLVTASFILTGCQSIPIVEKDESNQVIQEEFTQNAVPLTNELNDYDLIDEFFPEDESDNKLEQVVIKNIKNDDTLKKYKLSVENMDLKLFVSEAGDVYFLAMLMDKRDNPNTLFGKLKKTSDSKYVIAGEHLARYQVNMPKTYLLEKDGVWVIVSQRPFSAFEECYFFKMEDSKMNLFKRGWEDPSLLYFDTMTALLESGKIDEAMKLPDESMYPMAYEETLFEMANLMINTSETKAIEVEKNNDVKRAIRYLEWSLNYYFQNHYGADLITMMKSNFTPFREATGENFGASYVLKEDQLKKVLLYYANLLGKNGEEKDANRYKETIERTFPK
jgi:hypothetical protein